MTGQRSKVKGQRSKVTGNMSKVTGRRSQLTEVFISFQPFVVIANKLNNFFCNVALYVYRKYFSFFVLFRATNFPRVMLFLSKSRRNYYREPNICRAMIMAPF